MLYQHIHNGHQVRQLILCFLVASCWQLNGVFGPVSILVLSQRNFTFDIPEWIEGFPQGTP